MARHTPGPWDFTWQIQPNGCPTVGHKGLMVCMVAHSAKQEDQRETAFANAALISAAPDLLEALQAMVAEYGQLGAQDLDYSDEVLAARAAIAKATGGAD